MLPSGWVTFAFTEIEGAARLAQVLGAGYRPVLRQYRRLLGAAVRAHGGAEVFTKSDCCLVAFPDAGAALAACQAAQAALTAARWPAEPRLAGDAVAVRMGLHSGSARPRGGEYASVEVHRAARITQAAHGGQVLCSAATAASATPLPPALSLRDLGLHRLRGFDGRERLFELVGPDRAEHYPPPRTAEPAPHNLPVALTSFVGRSAERAALAARLADRRLVTVTGAPGVGKSRLAVQVAAEQVAAYPDGVWYRDLARVTAPGRAAPTVASALGLPPVPDQMRWRALVRSLPGRRLLLVLDGCDAWPDGAVAAVVTRLLAECPGVRVLATGGHPVGVPGEEVWQLRALSLPPADGGGDAVRLLVERVAAARGGVAPDPVELPALTRIAVRLGGVPLAIEQAAARLRVLSAGQLAARLEPARLEPARLEPARLGTAGTRSLTPPAPAARTAPARAVAVAVAS